MPERLQSNCFSRRQREANSAWEFRKPEPPEQLPRARAKRGQFPWEFNSAVGFEFSPIRPHRLAVRRTGRSFRARLSPSRRALADGTLCILGATILGEVHSPSSLSEGTELRTLTHVSSTERRIFPKAMMHLGEVHFLCSLIEGTKVQNLSHILSTARGHFRRLTCTLASKFRRDFDSKPGLHLGLKIPSRLRLKAPGLRLGSKIPKGNSPQSPGLPVRQVTRGILVHSHQRQRRCAHFNPKDGLHPR
jgi:hypothetical protein